MLKYELIPEQLLHEGTIEYSDLNSPDPVDGDIVTETHDPEYWLKVKNLDLNAAEIRRIGFPLSEKLIERETRIAQGTINGALHALQHQVAFNVAGGTHHAGSDWGEGFCILNDQAIAANCLLRMGYADRIAIVDLDVHQGNGTAEIFHDDSRVFTFSMHAKNNFPFRKEVSDLDISLDDGTSGEDYLSLLKAHLNEIVVSFKPQFVFYLAGVDVLATDKLGKLLLTTQECKERDKIVLETCHRNKLPIQISMGGGYSPDIRHIVDAHCNTFRLAKHLYG